MSDAIVRLDLRGRQAWVKLMRIDFLKWKVDKHINTKQESFFYMGRREGTYLFICDENVEGGIYDNGIPFPAAGNFTEQFSKSFDSNDDLWEFLLSLPSGAHFKGLLKHE